MLNELKRFFHFGPIIALGIIKSITIMTLYMNSMWWPPVTVGGFINQAVFLVLSALTVMTFVMASIVGPGLLPYGWKPKEKAAEQYLQYCNFCEGYKAPRSHHCRVCQRCVIKMDHHCPWINNCCGYNNQMYFICFLGLAVIGCLHAATILICTIYSALTRDVLLRRIQYPPIRLGIYSLILSVFNIGLSVGVIIAVGMLLYLQLRAVIRNRTGIEDWIITKASFRRSNTTETFTYPYDLGWKQNVRQFVTMGFHPANDGTAWPVVDGCDQYTLTREQLEQKKEKQKRTTFCNIIRPATGSWLPFWSQGIKVACCVPLTDEPRIRLGVGDTVRVTRWRKHWLFGEKIIDNQNSDAKKIRIRGWFPRQCAIEMSWDYEHEEEDDEGTTNGIDTNHSKKVN